MDMRDLPDATRENVEKMTPEQREEWCRRYRIAREFPGLENYIETLFFSRAGRDATTDARLGLLWGLIQDPNSSIDGRQFKRLVGLIQRPESLDKR